MTTADGRYVAHLQRRDLQLPGAAARARGARPCRSARAPTPRSCCTRSRSGAIACVERFNGMFAFAIWDRDDAASCSSRATASASSRSTTGSTARRFLFGSEIKAILAHPALRSERRPARACSSTSRSRISSPTARCFAGRAAAAGRLLSCSVTVGDATARISRRSYWDFRLREPGDARGDADEYLEELDRLFRQAVSRQLVSDVDVGSYLSGGMDSGSITALAARQLPDIKYLHRAASTCSSASGVELGFDERQPGRAHVVPVQDRALRDGAQGRRHGALLPRLAWHLEEPRVGQCYPNYYAAQLATSS